MLSRRLDVKQLFRRLVAGHAVGQLYGISCGPCAPIEYQPPDVTVSESQVTNEPLSILCEHVCGGKALTCAGASPPTTPLPTSFPCRDGVDEDGRAKTVDVAVDAATFGPEEREAWLTLSELAQVKAVKTGSGPAPGAECRRICKSASSSEGANLPVSCSFANREVVCTPPTRQSVDNCAAGRVPFGLVAPRADTRDEAERFWILTQHMEAASVLAFEELAETLAHHGAPADLVARCIVAAAQEQEHARLAERELRARGLVPVIVRRAPPAPASLLEVALHNAAEGCITETRAALLAIYESQANPEPAVRAFFERVATDETEHAQLAWDLHAWFLATLSRGAARALTAHLEECARAAGRTSTAGSTLFDAAARHELAIGIFEEVLEHSRAA